jgi:hypothetical protein
MTDLTVPPPYQYIACIDEAGDPGIRRVRPIDDPGASEWLVLAGVLFEIKHEQDSVQWVRDILKSVNLAKRTSLHFRELSEWRKPLVCESLAQLPLTAFAMISNKKTMRGHRNARAAFRSEGTPIDQVFYNFCVRLILERITDYCYRHSMWAFGEPRHVKIIFSERGAHSYARAFSYQQILKHQSMQETTHLMKRTINWRVFDTRLLEVHQHHSDAGVQLADVVASSFYQAVDVLPPTVWNPHNAKLLKPCVARESGFQHDYGVAFQPIPAYRARLVPKQKLIFEFYGYDGRDF